MATQIQPLGSFFARNILPGATSDLTLSGGNCVPFYYSLGVNSTVPFVRLEGSGFVTKDFSWGETIEVPAGQQVKVTNASYHAGDIEIKSGRDVANIPAKVAVVCDSKVSVITKDEVNYNAYEPKYPVDTRRAKRAFLLCDVYVGPESAPGWLSIIGWNRQHSWESQNTFFSEYTSLEANETVDYGDTGPTNAPGNIQIQPGQKYISKPMGVVGALGSIPLGFQSYLQHPSEPHALADSVSFVIFEPNETSFSNVVVNNLFFWLLEYA